MRFLLDAHLPARFAALLKALGHDAISKDSDFVNSQLLSGKPGKLLNIRVGNTSNRELLELVERRLPEIVTAIEHASRVELHRTLLVVHTTATR